MKAILDFILERRNIEVLFNVLAVSLPILGLVIGLVVGRIKGRIKPYLITFTLAGLFGPFNWVMWRIYNAITDHYGLDTVKNLLINLALFIVVGIVLGVGIGLVRRGFINADRSPEK